MSAGEVVQCAHCGGSGTCSCSGCNYTVLGRIDLGTRVACASCDGAGKVWVGPNNSNDDDYDDNDEDEDS